MAKASSNADVCLYLLAILLPFVSVFLKRGCSADVLINILLCVLGWIPGVIHAWYVIGKHDPANY
ncbi:hypothetical protein MBM_09211 [Drepanopeziza brunnea f. sp. 'multigermtubi' MB_m1]|uniref:Stress response RCI peptide n=1 Tax=Marssonina brunnea f. sp. multigermtubi (strain MB_m1) TaxID=1072389 RepID=K1WKC3_MARBU|nr:uncharacterized protein MBM_09211 [Drepanopeziza brunnea f. sp. 'multigermtubi' MB_m1]EKD12642.1 hypothetical protein MBM_09211 [Drepanopeziza brunnea f. sp. 'multigermtubi' MB_m1]